MNCEHVRHHLDSYVRGETPAGVTAEVARHLESCAACREEEVIARHVADGLKAMRLGAPAGLADRIIAGAPTPVARRLGWFTPVRALAATLLVVAVVALTREGRRLMTDEGFHEMTVPVAVTQDLPEAAGHAVGTDKIILPQSTRPAEMTSEPAPPLSTEPGARDRRPEPRPAPPAAARPAIPPARRSVAVEGEAAVADIVNAPQEIRAYAPAPATPPASSAPAAPAAFGASGSSAKSVANEDNIPAASSTGRTSSAESTSRYRTSPRSFSIMVDADDASSPESLADSVTLPATSVPSPPDTTTDSPARR